jgi:hypothetical protein
MSLQPQKNYPKNVNIYNLKSFFDYKTISASQITPGMILSFTYKSPEGVHDRAPLIYVLEVDQDRIWGLNLHYKFVLLGEVIQVKRGELAKTQPSKEEQQPAVKSNENQKPGDPTPRPEQLNQKLIPSLSETKGILKIGEKPILQAPPKKIVYPNQLLEHYTMTEQPKEILRNYLYPRISTLQKLVFKVL